MSFGVMRKINQRLVASLLLITLGLGIAVATMPSVKAETAGQGIQVSPVVIDLNGEKGGSYTLRVTVTNITAGTLDLKTAVNDFKANGETGNPQVITDDTESNTTYSLQSWVSAIPKLVLRSKESRSLSFNVNIPKNAEAGGHYGVIRFSGVPPELAGQNVSLTASVGVLLLARVDGQITENLTLSSLKIRHNNKNSSLVSNGPVDIQTRLHNDGNVHVKPVGTLTVKNTFGKVVATYPFGSTTKNVLPKSTRAFDQKFDKRFLFGRYTVQLQAAYGTTGGVVLGSTSFWVIPFKLILFLLIILTSLFIMLRRFIRNYNRRIIHRSQNGKKKHN